MFSAPKSQQQALKSTVEQYLDFVGFTHEPGKTYLFNLKTIEHLLEKHLDIFSFSSMHANANKWCCPIAHKQIIDQLMHDGFGTCYHHNIAIGEACRHLGFEITYQAAYFIINEVKFPQPSHLLILLHFDNNTYVIDPGLCNALAKPIKICPLEKQSELLQQTQFIYLDKTDSYQALLDNKPTYEFTNHKYSHQKQQSVNLIELSQMIKYISSTEYVFQNLFLMSFLTEQKECVLIINHHVKIADSTGTIINEYQLKEDSAILPQIALQFPKQKTIINNMERYQPSIKRLKDKLMADKTLPQQNYFHSQLLFWSAIATGAAVAAIAYSCSRV